MRVALASSILVIASASACKKEPLTLDAAPASTVVSGATSAGPVTLGKDLSEGAAGEAFAIKLDREPCYGVCPSYTLEIDADGAVRYRGRAFVAVRGPMSTRVDAAAVARLVARLDASGFFRMTWKDPCDSVHTDSSTATTTLVRGGRKRSIRNYHGNHCMPAALNELEDEIDRVAGTAAWTKCDGDYCNE